MPSAESHESASAPGARILASEGRARGKCESAQAQVCASPMGSPVHFALFGAPICLQSAGIPWPLA
eukprot:6385398-Alexandrium_andersonii.AAC.1